MGLKTLNTVLPFASETPRVAGGCALRSSEDIST